MYEKFNQYLEGLISENELMWYLENISIRGSITFTHDGCRGFIGFDYKNQNWVRIN